MAQQSKADVAGTFRDDVKGIAGEKALRYKRNVLVVSLVVFALRLADLKLGSASLFGITLPETIDGNMTSAVNDGLREVYAWRLIGVIMLYQIVLLWFYGWRDFARWKGYVSSSNVAFSGYNPPYTANFLGYMTDKGNRDRQDIRPLLTEFWRVEFGFPMACGVWALGLIVVRIYTLA
jgi:hypothetical protein